jgi:thiamine pyrophosphokinase
VLIAPVEAVLGAPAGVRVSLVPVGAAATVTLEGLDYPLDRGTLPAEACLGLGNHVTAGGAARVIVHDGTVVALVAWGEEPFRTADGVRDAR